MSGKQRGRLLDHLRRKIDPLDRDAARSQIRRDLSGAASDVDDATVADGCGERVEEAAIERLGVELVLQLFCVCVSDRRVAVANRARIH